jgi:mercuric ion binding protein
MKTLVFAAALMLVSTIASAETRQVTLAVSNLTCAACPITVKKSLTKVPGIREARVDFETKEAVVTFDDAKTTAAALVKATTDAGYPSTVKTAPGAKK